MKNEWRILAAVCAVVVGVYAYVAQSGILELFIPDPAEVHYNLLVRGFRAGHLSLKKEVPIALTQLSDPYDPTANAVYQDWPYRMLDLSYYKGKLYLYWGVTPALILFWPFVALTGKYLFQREAVEIFCAIGFLTSVGLLRALWRRHFPGVSVWVVVTCALALGLASGAPLLLSQADVYEVPISCGYMLMMLMLGAIWCALHEPRRRHWWLAAASLAYGLAVGSRPNLLFGGVILLIPVVQAWRERQQPWFILAAATVPAALIGAGLMLYNELRFNSPIEFGVHYQLTWERQITRQFFSLRFLWFNFLVYFFEPARWSSYFPFVREIAIPSLPLGYTQVTSPFGVLTNIPLTWMALAAPLAWHDRPSHVRSVLRLFVAALVLLFGVCALTLGIFCASNFRYQVDFLPALVLLAVIGILATERALAPTSESGLAQRTAWRRAVRYGWGLLLAFSVVFNLLACVEPHAKAHFYRGNALERTGNIQAAIGHYQQAIRLTPDFAEGHNGLGLALLLVNKPQEAAAQFEQALRAKPDYPEAHFNLGLALEKLNRTTEAIEYYQLALRDRPDYVEAHVNLGGILFRMGRMQEAAEEYESALRIKPDFAVGHSNLGAIYQRMGKSTDAAAQYELALRINPNYVEAHYNLGLALEALGRTPEAIEHYQQALKLRPDYAPAKDPLTRLGAGQ
jgi:tetratricopeptide (TPR) repeat protein